MSNPIDLSKICYFLVTGASQGIGQTMAIECSKNFKPGSIVVLVARSASGLENTKTKILESNSKITVFTFSIDLTSPSKDELKEIIDKSLNNVDRALFELAFIIHNIGTIGDISKKANDIDDHAIWQDYFSVNVFSVAILNSQFMNTFEATKKFIVNLTSKAAICPIKSFTLYCSGKAAREMYFKVLADEYPIPDNLIVLNYSPGPVETDMVRTVCKNTNDSDVKDYFETIRNDSTILTTEKTTEKFLQIIKNGIFKSGDHVDYYD